MTLKLRGGAVRDPATDQNFRGLAADAGRIGDRLTKVEEEGLPPSGEAGGVVKGPFSALEFAVDMATQAELESGLALKQDAATAATDAELASERSARESADAAEALAREEADKAEKSSRESADAERIKGPASSTESDIAIFSGTTGKVVKDSGKTIATVLLEAEEVARALAAAAAAGLTIKSTVAYATAAALTVTAETATTLEGIVPLSIDGNSLWTEGTRVLLKNQASAKQNGIYVVTKAESFEGTGIFEETGTFEEGEKWLLTRAADADTEAEVKQGMFVPVSGGATNGSTVWLLTSENPITIGTTAQNFSQFTATPVGAAGGDLSGTYPNPQVKEGAIVNADVNVAAAIAYSKLALASSITTSDLAAGNRNYGLVSSLPTEPTPAAGDVCRYWADKTNGIIWDLIYDGEGEYKWKKIGGPPLYAASDIQRETSSTTYASLATDPLKITVPLKGDYDIEISGRLAPQGETRACWLSYAIGATAAADSWAAQCFISAGDGQLNLSQKTRQSGVAASAVIEEKGKSGGAYTVAFIRRRLWVDPVRVG